MKWIFIEGAEPQGSSDGFWYDINQGYIAPEKVLADKSQLKVLNDALDVVRSFEEALSDNGLLEEF